MEFLCWTKQYICASQTIRKTIVWPILAYELWKMPELHVNKFFKKKKKKPLHFELQMLIIYTHPSKKKKKLWTTGSLQNFNDSVFIIFILIDFGLPNPLVSPQPIIDEGSSPPCLFLLQTPLPCPCRNEPRSIRKWKSQAPGLSALNLRVIQP